MRLCNVNWSQVDFGQASLICLWARVAVMEAHLELK